MIDPKIFLCYFSCFSNEVPEELLKISKFILVDHHVATSFANSKSIIQIIDHRPLDEKNAKISIDCNVTINEVGSCATLVADEIRKMDKLENHKEILHFLRGPIVLDTINFAPSADKAKPLDVEINAEIEHLLDTNSDDRLKLFNDLVKARSDVSSLSSLQLLSKDLKIITNENNSKSVAIPGIPILIEVSLFNKKYY